MKKIILLMLVILVTTALAASFGDHCGLGDLRQ